MSPSIVRVGRLVAAAGLLSAGLIATGLPARAAAIQHGAAPQDPTGRLLSAQAQPNAAPAQNVETSISQLHQKLQIASAQEPQFNALAAVMRDNARSMPSSPPPRAANPTAIDDLRTYIQFSEQELAGLKRLLPALDALYASLSPAQKKTADTVFRQGPGG